MQGEFPSVARRLGILKAAAVSLSAALCFGERGNAKKLGAFVRERQPETHTGCYPVYQASVQSSEGFDSFFQQTWSLWRA